MYAVMDSVQVMKLKKIAPKTVLLVPVKMAVVMMAG
jgi:hypothetical protein